jgi:hypothetical protein
METIELKEIVLNEEQKKAILKIQEFIKKGDPNEWFVLEGKAGVGKTTIMTRALLPFISKKRIVLSALSHKAKKVIHEKIKNITTDEPRGLFSYSVASILGMTFDLETGQFVKIYSRKKPKIKNMDIIIVDECSMINEMGLQLIMSEKKKTAKVIFLGDVGQLPPIREDGNKNQGNISPTFNTLNRYKLYNRVRQNSGSTILPYSDFYWENSVLSEDPIEDPVPYENRYNTDDMVFKTNLEETILENKETFLQLRNPKMQDLIKVVVYKNSTREMINWYIRSLIYENPKEFEVGDILIFNDNYGDGDEIMIENSTEVTVVSIRETTFNGRWFGYYLDVTDNESFWTVEVLSKKTYPEYNKYISELFKKAKSLPMGRTRTNQLKVAWEAKRRFANVDFGYAITSHKSQGSTYKYVIVVEDDILSIGPITSVEKSQSMYTAITRASDKVFIVSDLNE